MPKINWVPKRRGKFKNIDKITLFVRFNVAHMYNLQGRISYLILCHSYWFHYFSHFTKFGENWIKFSISRADKQILSRKVLPLLMATHSSSPNSICSFIRHTCVPNLVTIGSKVRPLECFTIFFFQESPGTLVQCHIAIFYTKFGSY